jgi:hypothetical protein
MTAFEDIIVFENSVLNRQNPERGWNEELEKALNGMSLISEIHRWYLVQSRKSGDFTSWFTI